MKHSVFYQEIQKLFLLVIVLTFYSLNAVGQCSGTTINVQAPANNLASIVANAVPGTCFYLPNGNYAFANVIPKDNMRFIGQSRGGVQVSGYGNENAFHGTADAVEIKNMTFHHFDDMGGAGGGPQEQSPIRGTPAIWVSNAGQMATNWVIDNIESHNNIAAGLFLGDHFTVTNSIFRDNAITGIGGDEMVGGLIKDNVIHGNGANAAPGSYVNGGGIKLTQAGSAADPVVIRDNEVYNNNKVGIWGDVACHGFEIINNYVYDHFSHGILYEISDNAYIAYNNCVNNTYAWSNITTDWSAGGITSAESKDVLIEYNTVTGSRGGIVIQQTYRPSNQHEVDFFGGISDLTLVSENVTIQHNTINGAVETGVGAAASGNGQLSNASNLQFLCNTYDNPNNMTFHWINGIQQTYAQWQAAGRDGVCNTAPDADNDGTPDDQDPDDNNPCIPSNTVNACDTDNDGIPDGLDTCPGFDNSLIGTTCNDNDSCTTNDFYTANCNCAGTFLDSDEDGICDNDDNSPYYKICQFITAPTIDGDLTDWGTFPTYSITNILSGTIGSNGDLSAEFGVRWDNTNLYLAGIVTDDALINDGGNSWENDGFEVYIDAGNEKATSYDANDHQLLFLYNDPTVYYHSGAGNDPVGVSFGMTPTNLGYVIEIQLSWVFLGATPSNNNLLGLDIHVNDDDDGAARDKKIAWSSTIDQAWSNPTLFGTYSLDANCNTSCQPQGTPCDDNDPNTTIDTEDGNCNCIGTPIITGTIVCETSTPPILDGSGNEWNQTNFTLTNPLNGIVGSSADLSGDFQVSWDGNYLYIFGDIKDDVLVNDSGTAAYKDDAFEVYIDGGNEKTTTYDANDHQLMFRVNDPDVNYWSDQSLNPAGVDFTRNVVSGGYEIEIRIAWIFIGITPSPAMDLGLDIHVIDDDDGGDSDKKLAWYTNTDQSWNNPSLFNTVTLSNHCNLNRMVDCIPTVLLEGTFDPATSLMTTYLQQYNKLPQGQPYTDAPWFYTGQEGAGWTDTDYPAGSVDWVLVSLRTSPLVEDQIARFSAVLLEDGTIQAAAPIAISQAINSVYVVVEHRNHLPAMSAGPVDILNNTIIYDFRAANSYLGTNGFGQKQVSGSWMLYAGNVDQTNPSGYEITGSDKGIWESMNGNFSVYEPTDFNLDSDVNGVDKLLWNYNNGISSSVPK